RRERAERRIRAVIAAYAVLNSPLRRAAYDRAHGYQFARPPMPVGGYVRRSSTRSAEQMRAATGNPNGAGQLAGILCVILAIALLGLYHGVPLTLQGVHGAGPEYVSIYRGPIERHCHYDPDAIREQVRATVLHELAHHFGIDHDDMPDWVK
ncbi:MAG TPA: metallopeptidase family protein, partial [Ktedonobacterales bacterium]|nr:metallopeptidase family protein [Ktedonobacterales bacterium]